MNNIKTKFRFKTDDLFNLNIESRSSSNSSLSSSLNEEFTFFSSSDNSSDYDEIERVIEEYVFQKIECCKHNLSNDKVYYANTNILTCDQNYAISNDEKELLTNEKVKLAVINRNSNDNEKKEQFKDNSFTIMKEAIYLPIKLFLKSHSVQCNNILEIKKQLTCRRFLKKYDHGKRIKIFDKLYSPSKAIILIKRNTSEIITSNKWANTMFYSKNLISKYLNNLIIGYYDNIVITDNIVTSNGQILNLPTNMVICKDYKEEIFLSTFLVHSIKSDTNSDNILVIMEKVEVLQGHCMFKTNNIVEFDSSFESFLFCFHNFKNKPCDEFNLEKLISGPNLIDNNSLLFYLSSFEYILNIEEMFHIETGTLKDTEKYNFLVVQMFFTLTNILVINENGYINDANSLILALLGYNKEEIKYKHIFNLTKIYGIDSKVCLDCSPGEYEGFMFTNKNDPIPIKLIIQKLISRYFVIWIWIKKQYISVNIRSIISKMNIFVSFKNYYSNFYGPYHNKFIDKNETKYQYKIQSFSEPIFSKTSLSRVKRRSTYNQREIVSNVKPIKTLKSIDLFFKYYSNFNIIGKGAFGYVRISRSKSSKQEYVVKFIRKAKLTLDHMVKVPLNEIKKAKYHNESIDEVELYNEKKICYIGTEPYIMVPKEIWMLHNLDHENIVKLHDWFEGNDHYQLVMTKHGIGMDLFEFIDRAPNLEEPLVSYIFRQLISAVAYLHSLSIAHRDIKDENIILDNNFKIKLIDFGAAVKVESEQKFKTFCGTMEFCCPEILLGQEYDCFKADIWSMGITLYTIMFGENPFYDFEETINSALNPPRPVSEELFQILKMILEPSPLKRISIESLQRLSWIRQEVNFTKYKFDELIPNIEFNGNIASDFRKYTDDSVLSQTSDHFDEKL